MYAGGHDVPQSNVTVLIIAYKIHTLRSWRMHVPILNCVIIVIYPLEIYEGMKISVLIYYRATTKTYERFIFSILFQHT